MGVALDALVIGIDSFIVLFEFYLLPFQDLAVSALMTGHEIFLHVTSLESVLDSAQALDGRSRSVNFLFVIKGLRPFECKFLRVAFFTDAIREAINLVTKHYANRSRTERSRAIRATDRHMPAEKRLMQHGVVFFPRSFGSDFSRQRWGISQHRVQSVFGVRLPDFLCRKHYHHRARILVDVEAKHIVYDFRFASLRTEHHRDVGSVFVATGIHHAHLIASPGVGPATRLCAAFA